MSLLLNDPFQADPALDDSAAAGGLLVPEQAAIEHDSGMRYTTSSRALHVE